MEGGVVEHIQKLAESTIEDITMDDVQILLNCTNLAFNVSGITRKERDDIRIKLDRLQNALHLAERIRVVF